MILFFDRNASHFHQNAAVKTRSSTSHVKKPIKSKSGFLSIFRMKKAFSLFLALLCLVLTACIDPERAASLGQDSSAQPPAATHLKLCASYPTLGSAFYGALNGAIQSAASAKDDRLIALDAGGDVSTQILQIEDMLTEGIDALFLAPADPAALRPLLENVRGQGVPVINVAVQVTDKDLVDAILVPNVSAAGSLCADDAIARLPGGGQVLVLEQPDSPLALAAVAAWDATITGEAWPVSVRLQTDGSAQQAGVLLRSFLQENPGGPDVIFTVADTSLPGIVDALSAANIRPGAALVYSMGGSPDAKRLIRDGWVTATAYQGPATLGAQAATTAYQILDGASYQKEQRLPAGLITGENIGEYSLDTWD